MRLNNVFFVIIFMLMIALCVSAKDEIIINDGWKFNKSNVEEASQIVFDDNSWENIQLPHTWNALDGQDGGNNYYRGIGWYRKHIVIPADYEGKVIYLKFGAANSASTVYLNGELIGNHIGGYSAFMFDISDKVLFSQENIIAVQVDNSPSIICPPLSADFTFFGGITRDVELILANPVHINPNEYISNDLTMGGIWVAQPGVIIKQANVSEISADLSILTKLRNTNLTAASVVVEVLLKDATGTIIKTFSDTKNILANDTSTSIITGKIDHPHLWDGINDPYLYKVEVVLKINDQIVDNSIQPLGFRYFNVDPDNGFILNGKPYPLRGICLHEEKKDKGRAVSDADRKEAIDMLRETGCNYLRLSHYQHGDYTYQYLDSLGIICWAEIPNINSVGNTLDENRIYRKNAVSQMYELLRQQYNHPCIVFWGLSNEIYYKSTIDPVGTVTQLNTVVKSEDTYRLTTLAAMYSEKPANWIPDVYANNRYDGWYYNTINDFGTTMDALHVKYPTRKIGVSEYGAGANINQHEYPAVKPNEGGPYHPEEYQNLFHEGYLKMINARPYIWSSSLWVGIDFASDGRNEGLQPGINDKGLITFDRKVKKDAFYWYKANWNKKEPFVYITSRRFVSRPSTSVTVKIYSNCPSVSLKVNGIDCGTKISTDHIFLWDNLTMEEGENFIEASVWFNDIEYTDKVTWNCTKSSSIPTYPEVPSGNIQINFEKITSITPNSYLKDDGSAYGDRGNGYTYGWNVNNTGNSRERNAIADKRFDTFVQMQTASTYTWSISLPNQWYKVSIASGDPSYTDSYHKIEANGVTIIDFFPTTLNKFGAGTAFTKVTNEKLLVKPASGASNAKINFIHITPVSEEEATGIENLSSNKKIQITHQNGFLIINNQRGRNDKINIYEISGRLIFSKTKMPQQVEIPISHYLSGIYLMEILSDSETHHLKIYL